MNRKKPWEILKSDIDIKNYLKSNHDILVTPKDALITMGNEETYQRAIRIMQAESDKKPNLLGIPLTFNQEQEPSNIIWNHLY